MNPVSDAHPAQFNPDTVKDPAMKSVDWKASLRSKLQTTLHDWHERAPGFEELLDKYVTSEPVKGRTYLRDLIWKCIALPEPYVLKDILRNEVVESMYIEGPIDAQGWKTLIAAMPAGFLAQALTLSRMCLGSSEVECLFDALCRMPKLKTLSLYMVGVQGSLLSERYGPAFEALETVIGRAGSDSDSNADSDCDSHFQSEPGLDICPLLLEVLQASQLQSLSIEDSGDITAEQHVSLAEALGRQTLLNSLSLIVNDPFSTPKLLDCYMPFLRGQAAFTTLHLEGWELETSNFNLLLAALRNKPTLTSLTLRSFKFLKGPGSEPVQISSLAGMRDLRDLDLGWNSLEDDTMGQLLLALKEQQTCLRFLGLNGNSIGSITIAATAALLNANRTLAGLSLQRAVLAHHQAWSADALEALAKALEANTSLQEFLVSWADIASDDFSRLSKFLERNRMASLANGMWAALNSARPGFPRDVATRMYERKWLTRSDAERMSSVNKAAWDARRGRGGPSM